MEVGLLDKEIGQYIVKAADEVIDGKWNDQFIVDPIQGGAGTSINMNANEVIANRALELMGEEKGNYSKISPNYPCKYVSINKRCFPYSNAYCCVKFIKSINRIYKIHATRIR